jgi:hypothetical protein
MHLAMITEMPANSSSSCNRHQRRDGPRISTGGASVLADFSKSRFRACGVAAWSTGCRVLASRERSAFEQKDSDASRTVFASSFRVALVKQTTYSDLYSDPAAATPRALLESSWHRTGPLGLFTRFSSRFIIVRPELDAECRVAEEKRRYGLVDAARAADDARRLSAQEAVAVGVNDINWSDFDMVIAIENAVPARVTRQYPGVLWATLLEHHKMAPFREYLRQAPPGYDAFLNLRYGPNPQSLLRRPHVIDWPYNFNSPNGLADLYPAAVRNNIVVLEDHQDDEMKRAIVNRGCRWTGGEITAQTLARFVATLAESKVFCAARPTRALGGLALIDAVAAGCVVIADRSRLWNPFLVTDKSQVSDAHEAAKLAARLLLDDQLFEQLRREQCGRLAWFCEERPLRQIAALVEATPRLLSARVHLISMPSDQRRSGEASAL